LRLAHACIRTDDHLNLHWRFNGDRCTGTAHVDTGDVHGVDSGRDGIGHIFHIVAFIQRGKSAVCGLDSAGVDIGEHTIELARYLSAEGDCCPVDLGLEIGCRGGGLARDHACGFIAIEEIDVQKSAAWQASINTVDRHVLDGLRNIRGDFV
jgi:hypothetical protein